VVTVDVDGPLKGQQQKQKQKTKKKTAEIYQTRRHISCILYREST
jgi:hypothetical protein